jgi:hypothetical protein
MKTFLVFLIIAVLGYFLYTRIDPKTVDTSGYSLKEYNEPTPKAVFFALWDDVALKQCADAREKHNLTPDECRALVRERAPGCTRSVGQEAPDKIVGREPARVFGKRYLECVTPYFFCNGVEVKSDAEATQHCK